MKKFKKKLCMLKNNLLKIVLTLCLLLTVFCSVHSQDTLKITITSNQLRTANLIFAEHKEFSKIIPLLKEENLNLKIINDYWYKTDSIKSLQLYQNQQTIDTQVKEIEYIQKAYKDKMYILYGITGTSIIVTILCLILN